MLIILTLMMLLTEAIGLGSTGFSWFLSDLAYSVFGLYMNVFSVLIWPLAKLFELIG